MDALTFEDRRRVLEALNRQASELEMLASGRRDRDECERLREEAEECRDLAERFK